MYGKDYEYARSRLNGTIVRHEKTPVMVVNINDNCECLVQDLEDGETKTVPLESLNLKPVPLGYCNVSRGSAVYLQRVPMRRDWRQGLRRENMNADKGEVSAINWKNIKKTILGEYPDVRKCIAEARKVGRVVAWSRYWATDGQFVFYKDYSEPVGSVVEDTISLSTDYQYLESCLAGSYANSI